MKNKFNRSIIPPGYVSQSHKVAQVPVANIVATHDDIAKQAYYIYLESGCLQGQSEQNWQQAEQELRNRSTVPNLLKKQEY